MLVYWDGKSFVSSDDYFVYLAYNSLQLQEVNVAIMGSDFPSALVRIKQRGNHKLLPPIGVEVSEEKITPGATNELNEWRAQLKEKTDDRLPIPTDLLTAWITFAELLSEEDPSERELHEFLTSFPIVLGAQWDVAESEVRFGKFRADIVLRAHRALPTVRLIELERPNHRLFTKDLHETDEVTHAVQQVSDWIRYGRQNPQDTVIATSRGVTPEGAVIIGRSRSLTDKEREILAHNNQGRDVKVFTYDELLDDFATLILHRLDDTREL